MFKFKLSEMLNMFDRQHILLCKVIHLRRGDTRVRVHMPRGPVYKPNYLQTHNSTADL